MLVFVELPGRCSFRGAPSRPRSIYVEGRFLQFIILIFQASLKLHVLVALSEPVLRFAFSFWWMSLKPNWYRGRRGTCCSYFFCFLNEFNFFLLLFLDERGTLEPQAWCKDTETGVKYLLPLLYTSLEAFIIAAEKWCSFTVWIMAASLTFFLTTPVPKETTFTAERWCLHGSFTVVNAAVKVKTAWFVPTC